MHLTRVILEYVRRSIANNNLLKNRNKPKELFSKEKKMDKWQTDVWHRGKHHWWSKPQSDELSSRWVASGRGDRNVSNFPGEREEECEWVAPHADSLRTKLHDCHVIQQLHRYIPKSKKVPVLEKSSGLHTHTRRALSPTEPSPWPLKAVLEPLEPAARKTTAITARGPPATSSRAREQSRIMSLLVKFEKQMSPHVLPVRGVLDSPDRWDSQQGKFWDRTAAHRWDFPPWRQRSAHNNPWKEKWLFLD